MKKISVLEVGKNTPENRLRNWRKFKEVWGKQFYFPTFKYMRSKSEYYNLARLYAYNGYTQEEHLPEDFDDWDDLDVAPACPLEDLIGRCELLEWNDITCMVEVYGTQYNMGPRKIFDFFGNEIGFYVDDKSERDYTHCNRIKDISEDMEGAWFYYKNA